MVGPLSLFPCRLAFVSDHSICWRITGSYILFLVVPSDVCSYYFSSCKRFLAVLFLSSFGSMFTRASTSAVILPRDMQVQLLLLRASASVFMNFSRILSCCVMDELDVLGFDRWKTTLSCIGIDWEWIEYILYVANFEFSYVLGFWVTYRRFDLLNIFTVFGGLEWAALGCSSSSQQQPSPAASSTSNPNDNSSRAAARGGAKCCPGWAPLRGDRTPGVWRAQGVGPGD